MQKEKRIRLQPSPGYKQAQSERPMLRLGGKWLKEYGFNAGDMVTVTVREELLVIQPFKK
jgi:hypothetical protein